VRAVDLAAELGVDPKRLRQWLRDNFVHEHNAAWDLTAEQERLARERFVRGSGQTSGSRVPTPAASVRTSKASRGGGRATSDESYVIELCDEVLGEGARRQHRFPWLLGDQGTGRAAVQLPVDAYYPGHNLVVEYRERQHYEATPFFDRRRTVSGVGRAEQRRLYDRRREEEVSRHGLRLVVISYQHLSANGRGRLHRNKNADLPVLMELLSFT
jgi:hypothetical protein